MRILTLVLTVITFGATTLISAQNSPINPSPTAPSTRPESNASPPQSDHSRSVVGPAPLFWAFEPRRFSQPPAVSNPAWVQSPIDAFILAKLEAHQAQPAPPVDKAALLRRATYNLTGLPPTIEELDAFLADASPNAFAQVVDRLLASPRYGERWGRHWLDVARYADSNGQDENKAIANAFRYRDYVIQAFNSDKPYDQFIREQLAGDLLPAAPGAPERYELWKATGFLVLGPKMLAEQDKPKLVMDIVDEQIDVTAKAFLGLTVSCARCHDHKFDPVSAREYYALAGIFKSTRTMENLGFVSKWNERPLADAETVARAEAHRKATDRNQKQLDQQIKLSNELLTSHWRKQLQNYLLASADPSTGSETNRSRASGSLDPASTEQATAPRSERSLAECADVDESMSCHQLHPLVVQRWRDLIHASATNPSAPFHLWTLAIQTPASQRAEKWPRLLQTASQHPSPGGALLISNLTAHPLLLPGLAPLAERYDQLFAGAEKTPASDPSAGATELRNLLHGANGVFALPNNPREFYHPSWLAPLVHLEQEKAALASNAPPPLDLALSVQEETPADLPVYLRGNHLSPGPTPVPRGVLEIFPSAWKPAMPAAQSGRLQLADWLTHPSHPLTSRVMVNRLWLWHFGEGLVRTPDNFGLRGEPPTHPELLDWLADEFIRQNWSIKQMHRLLLLSSAFQMSCRNDSLKTPSPIAQADPENRLLSYMPRRRLEAEPIRDALLFLGGNLDLAAGGSLLTTRNDEYVRFDGYSANRRAVYLPVIRDRVYDVFSILDFANPSVSEGKRAATVVSHQALFFLNSPLVREQAAGFARSLLAEPGLDLPQRIQRAYRRALARPPAPDELDQAAHYLQHAERLASAQTKPRPVSETHPSLNSAEFDAWQSFCQALFASNEFIYLN